MTEYETTQQTTRKVIALPCIRCGCTEVSFWWDKEYMMDYVTCKNPACKHQVTGPQQDDHGAAVLKIWNPANDPKSALVQAKLALSKAQAEVERLTKLARR